MTVPAPRPPSPALIAPFDAAFDPAASLLSGRSGTQGYHTALPTGTPVHPTRESLAYAYACLLHDEPARRARGRDTLAAVLALQDTDALSPTYGTWGLYAEEPPARMHAPDLNWADFLGALLADILLFADTALTPPLRAGARSALHHAAGCIYRRNVGLDYTNIAAMGAAVCLVAGDILAEPRLSAYGALRLARLRARVEAAGGFAEYNSPTYALTALAEFERVLALVRDPASREHAEFLRRLVWRLVADHFHPGTGQWAGPQSRAYQLWLDARKHGSLRARLGFDFPLRPAEPAASGAGTPAPLSFESLGLEHTLPCPEDIAPRFRALPAVPHLHRHVWTRRADGAPRLVTTTWFDEHATLGSANAEITWAQPQPVVAYWRSAADLAARLRVRVLLHDRDFAAGQLRCTQDGPALLAALDILPGEGTYHPHFDKPADGAYAVRDLRLRVELHAADARLDPLPPAPGGGARWALVAGDRRVVLHAGPGFFDGAPLARWESGSEPGRVWVDAVLHAGSEKNFHPARAAATALAFALELGPVPAPAADAPVALALSPEAFAASWSRPGHAPLALTLPRPPRRET